MKNIIITPEEFITMGKLFNCDVQIINQPINKFNNRLKRFDNFDKSCNSTIVSAYMFMIHNLEDIKKYFEKYENSYIGLLLNEDGELLWKGDWSYFIRICIVPKNLNRKQVYHCIDTERDYQDLMWSNELRVDDVSDEEKPVSEWVNYCEYHLNKAKVEIYHLHKDNALEELRKVAALAVRCMEIHGCKEREIKPLKSYKTN